VELDLGGRWDHPIGIFHGRARRAGAPEHHTRHAGRMSVELAVARAASGALATLWLGIVAHQVSVYQFGQVTLVLSLGSLVSIGTDLGIPLALSKVSCDFPNLDHGAVWRAVITRLLAGLVAGAVLIGLWINSASADRWWLAGLYAVSVTVTPLGGSFLAMLRGRAIGIVEAVYDVVSKAALLGVGLLTLAAGWKPSGVIGAFVVVDFVSSLILPVVSSRHLPMTTTPDPLQRAELRLRATLPLAAAGLLGTAYERIDVWVLALLKGSTSVGVYTAAYKLYDTALLPASAIAAAAVAAAGPNLIANARPTAKRLAIRAVVTGFPIAVVVAVISPVLLRAAFGHHYGSASTAVVILMVASLPGAALAAITPIAMLCRRQVVVKWIVGGLVGNVVGNLVLVPALGIRGAALAFLITETILLVAFFAVLPKPTAPATASAAPTTAPAAA
jgi:O-antigen/teichoic acid export membrane protein